MSRAKNEQVTGNGTSNARPGSGAKLNGWRYILAWQLTWVVLIMSSMTLELLPGIDRSRGMPDWCGPGIDDPRSAAEWTVLELICGLLWSIVAYVLYRLAIRLTFRFVLQRPLSDWLRQCGASAVVALAMAGCFGLPLALIDPEFRNYNIAGDLCRTIQPWALKVEACFIPVAFAVASIVAGHLAVKTLGGKPADTDAERAGATDDDLGIWPPAPEQ